MFKSIPISSNIPYSFILLMMQIGQWSIRKKWNTIWIAESATSIEKHHVKIPHLAWQHKISWNCTYVQSIAVISIMIYHSQGSNLSRKMFLFVEFIWIIMVPTRCHPLVKWSLLLLDSVIMNLGFASATGNYYVIHIVWRYSFSIALWLHFSCCVNYTQ